MKSAASALLHRTSLWQPWQAACRAAKTVPDRLRFASSRRSVARSVFIVGAGHSGTSLLLRILGEHPQVFAPNVETGVFNGGVDWSNLARLYTEARDAGRSVLVEKTPQHVHSADLIRATVPGALFIVVVRDGRDVVSSRARRHGGNFDFALKRWQRFTEASIAQLGRADAHLWRYEDFIDDPESSIRAVCSFVSIDFDPAMLDYHRRTKPFFGQPGTRKGSGADGAEHNALRAWQINQPIIDGRGKWRDTLPHAVAAKFRDEPYRSLMLRLGYDPET